MPTDPNEFEYAGFWIRVWAALIDTFLVLLITTPVLGALYGWDYGYQTNGSAPFRPTEFLISWVLPAVAVILFWRFRSATPGKMVIGAIKAFYGIREHCLETLLDETRSAGPSAGVAGA
jgi:uncharacterized RDD family membrane protein YckC